MNIIHKSNGTTKSEQYLAKLCESAFLSLWSYPNLYTNEGINKNRTGKELCDLLVVFDEHILIFSDKNIAFSKNGKAEVKWKRWVKKAVLDSSRQIYGAEKWIIEKPDRIFMDKQCTQQLPIKLSLPLICGH